MIDEEYWLTITKAATALGVSSGTIRKYADRGILKCYRLDGGHRRFKREDINDFLEKASNLVNDN